MNTGTPPIIQKKISPNTSSPSNNEIPISDKEEDYFKFLEHKKFKVIIALISGLVGIISNYFAIKYQISQTRIDFINHGIMIEVYALGVTLFLDLAVILFHLMRIPLLAWVSSASAILVSLYANMNILVQNKSLRSMIISGSLDLSYGGLLLVSLIMSILPIFILTYMMHLVVKSDEKEKNKKYEYSI